MENKNFNNLTFTNDDVELAKQFFPIFKEHYEKAFKFNEKGFKLEFLDPVKHTPIFRCEIWGKTFDRLTNKDFYVKTVTNLAMSFAVAFKLHYFNEKN